MIRININNQRPGSAHCFIMARDNFYASDILLANWKTQKGMQTVVKKLSWNGNTLNVID